MIAEEKVPCATCGEPTPMRGTERCNNCWEVEHRLEGYLNGGSRARAFLEFAMRRSGGPLFKSDRDFGIGVPGLIAEECYTLRDLLIAKNAAYGNSALQPLRIMSRADPEEQIRVRIDDKLSRLARGDDAGEDVIQDLLGYLILLRIARRINAAKVAEQLEESLSEPRGAP
jgi:hypothetical protein